jgi:multidrug efflux system membrane fusion protein
MELNMAERNLFQTSSNPASRPAGPLEKYWNRAGVLAFVVGVIVAGCKPKTTADAPAGGGRGAGGFGQITVSAATASRGSIGIYVNALGVVTPLKTVSINSRVQGQIVAVKYTEGQDVKVGDPLVEIDPGPSQAALTQAEGQLKRDRAILEDAKLDLDRYKEAFASNAIPKQQLDTQTATVEQDTGTVELDQGLLDNARVQLAYCHITAPISGRVGLRLVDEGNMVQANGTTALVVITELKPITVIFNVAEDALPGILAQLRAGKTLPVDALDRAQTKKLATGTLEALDNQIDTASGTVKFRAVFTNDDEALFPNQFVNARLLVRTLENATLLPNAVIQRNADGAFVYLLKQDSPAPPTNAEATDSPATNAEVAAAPSGGAQAGGQRTNSLSMGTVAMQAVTVETYDATNSAVQGIDPGTVVVADNFNKLTDGAKVAIRPGGSGGGRGGSGSGNGSGHRHKDQPARSQ